jgi:hypothetical protein
LNTGKAFCRNLRAIEIDKPPPDATAAFDLDLMRRPVTAAQPPVDETALAQQPGLSLDQEISEASLAEKLLEYSLDIVDWAMAFLVVIAAVYMIVFRKGSPGSAVNRAAHCRTEIKP